MNSKRYVLSVSALIWNETGQVLLLQRARDCKHFAGAWEPPGGKSIKGEEIGATVLREVQEEAGLEIELNGVAGVAEFELSHLRVAVLYFHAHVLSGVPRLSAEHCKFLWVAPTEVKSVKLTEPFRRLLENAGFHAPRPIDQNKR